MRNDLSPNPSPHCGEGKTQMTLRSESVLKLTVVLTIADRALKLEFELSRQHVSSEKLAAFRRGRARKMRATRLQDAGAPVTTLCHIISSTPCSHSNPTRGKRPSFIRCRNSKRTASHRLQSCRS